MNRMNATLRYTQLGFAITALLDKQEPLDADQARQYVEDGSLFTWLGRRYDQLGRLEDPIAIDLG